METKINKAHYREYIKRFLFFICTVSLITYFLPREGSFNYQYDLNKPWRYGLLQAPFDFPIHRQEAIIQAEKDSVLTHFQPYYIKNIVLGDSLLAAFTSNVANNATVDSIGKSYTQLLEKELRMIYNRGIISNEQLNYLKNNHLTSIKIITNKVSTLLPIDQLYTPLEAYNYLKSLNSSMVYRSRLQTYQLQHYLTPSLLYDSATTEGMKAQVLKDVSIYAGMVQSGQKIVAQGEIINSYTYGILNSLRSEYQQHSDSSQQQDLLLIGQIIFVSLFIFCFMIYLDLFQPEYYKHKRSLLLVFSLIIGFTILTSLMVRYHFFHVYIIPFAMLPMIVCIFLDSRTAFMSLVITTLLASLALNHPYEFILLQIVAGLVAILTLRELSQRSQMVKSAGIIVCSYILLDISIGLLTSTHLGDINLSENIYFLINGVFLLFTYPLLFILEKMFRFTSNVTLVELSNINNKLLQQLSEEAPGTFQHSMQMANLAAEAAKKIGANSQLVRTGALYHDIGKLGNPAFFTENQTGFNPHNQLNYQQSANIIIDHVDYGIKLAEKNNLPEVIKDFIRTHHGKGLTKYFYISYQNEHPNEKVDKEPFSYPGPNPFSKETAILMMADSVEAASRSLPEYTEESIRELVEKIIESQVQEGYFKYSPITFRDIADVKEVFTHKLMTMYHTRISYPELKK